MTEKPWFLRWLVTIIRKIMSATSAFYGTWNATITKYDTFSQSLAEYNIHDIDLNIHKQKSCWLLVDAGYSRCPSHLQYPFSDHSGNVFGWTLRTQMESFRKDTKCTFGIL